jgi:hypothetical protein
MTRAWISDFIEGGEEWIRTWVRHKRLLSSLTFNQTKREDELQTSSGHNDKERMSSILTVFIHAHLHAFLESTRLTLISMLFVDCTGSCSCLTSDQVKESCDQKERRLNEFFSLLEIESSWIPSRVILSELSTGTRISSRFFLTRRSLSPCRVLTEPCPISSRSLLCFLLWFLFSLLWFLTWCVLQAALSETHFLRRKDSKSNPIELEKVVWHSL